MKNNNSGFSLAELLVALGIGSIVSTAIASLIVISLRMYNNESVNAGMQYELQTSLNEFVDSIQASQGLILKTETSASTGNNFTSYVAVGHFNKTATAGKYDFDGDVYYVDQSAGFDPYASGTDGFEIYKLHVSPGTVTNADIDNIVSSLTLSADKKHLLSKDCTKFLLECKSDCLDATATDPADYFYVNPLSIDIHLTFQKQVRGGKMVNKNVDDTARIRNKIKVPIIVDSKTYFKKE